MKPIRLHANVRLALECALPGVLIPLCHYLAYARYGSSIFLWLEMAFVLLGLAWVLIGLAAVPMLFVRRWRPAAVRNLIGAVVLIPATLIGMKYAAPMRKAAFHELARRSVPLVQAIKAYEVRHGSPPADLESLVPELLPAVPETGMGAYPNYEYHVGQFDRYHDNPWVLTIFTPSGGINFDQFMYFPLQNYPEDGYGGWLERIDDWAYVHE